MSKQIRMALIAAAATAATFGASSAMAADGTINFTGSIIAASCSLVGGSGTNVGGSQGNQIIDVKLGKVTTDSLGGTAGGNIIAGTAINLDLNCDNSAQGLNTVKVRFDPVSGSGIDKHNNKLLAITGPATGVGIGLYNGKNELLDLSGNSVIEGELAKDGDKYTAKLALRAGYVKNGDAIGPGEANGTLPFTLTYE
ncbi:fimbrial protein [Cupriavidus malaysiensis]|uniref:Fimbrial protein n=1 Tax=Cupriavidus malaysiensis TaxID=367825 RepID=A0ABN4TGU7_9BURK|nr:fimbrial protein [Cupriavidus malaysiensis]AOZ06397.1 fimbrial protein [Cupriavidus malaysiensis]